MALPSFLNTKIEEIRSRLVELESAYQEFLALQRVVEALEGSLSGHQAGADTAAAEPAPRRPVRRPKKARQRRPAGTLKAGLVKMVGERPGLTGGELADALDVARPSVVTMAKHLERDGVLERRRVVTAGRARIEYFLK